MPVNETNQREVFERHFDIEVHPRPARGIVLTDRVHASATELARVRQLEPFDLRNLAPVDALRRLEHMRVSAVLGRGGMDKGLKKVSALHEGSNVYSDLRESGVLVVSRFGNGVDGIDANEAFDRGLIVERVPQGNATAVRLWQDLQLYYLLERDKELAAQNNPAAADNRAIKEQESVKKLSWSRHHITEAVNPNSLRDDIPPLALAQAEYFRGKKVAVIGPGRIGMEAIRQSVFLRDANIFAYDIVPGREIEGVTVTHMLEEALQDAELVLLHIDGEKAILGAEQLRLLKDGAIVCNAARGKNIDPKALFEALESGKVGGAALDTSYVEGEDLLPFVDVPSTGEKQPEHYAHLLRRHTKVVAGNHSAASDEVAELENARCGIQAVYQYLTKGEVIDGVAAPHTVFPVDGFVQPVGDRFVPREPRDQTMPPRFVMELLHDGNTAGLIVHTRRLLGEVVKARLDLPDRAVDLNVVAGNLTAWERNGRRNAIQFDVLDFPRTAAGKQVDPRLWGELNRAAESIPGVRMARTFVPQRKAA